MPKNWLKICFLVEATKNVLIHFSFNMLKIDKYAKNILLNKKLYCFLQKLIYWKQNKA